MGLAFVCDSPAAVDRVYEELTGLGYAGHKAPWDAFWAQRYATVHDPDGNAVDLFAPLRPSPPYPLALCAGRGGITVGAMANSLER
jgi:hypothetical protein